MFLLNPYTLIPGQQFERQFVDFQGRTLLIQQCQIYAFKIDLKWYFIWVFLCVFTAQKTSISASHIAAESTCQILACVSINPLNFKLRSKKWVTETREFRKSSKICKRIRSHEVVIRSQHWRFVAMFNCNDYRQRRKPRLNRITSFNGHADHSSLRFLKYRIYFVQNRNAKPDQRHFLSRKMCLFKVKVSLSVYN